MTKMKPKGTTDQFWTRVPSSRLPTQLYCIAGIELVIGQSTLVNYVLCHFSSSSPENVRSKNLDPCLDPPPPLLVVRNYIFSKGSEKCLEHEIDLDKNVGSLPATKKKNKI